MTAQELYVVILKKLKSAAIESAELEANWVLEHFCELTFVQRINAASKSIDNIAIEKAISATSRRCTGEPLAYILGYREFFGLKFKVNEDTLIPRPETEQLVEWGLDWLKDNSMKNQDLRAVDLGTGSGCIAVSLAKMTRDLSPKLKISAIEKSRAAAEIAKENALAHEVTDRLAVICVDAIEYLNSVSDEALDLILANPPYIDPTDEAIEPNVKKYEPHAALFSSGGTDTIRDWLNAAAPKLKKHAALGFEIGSGQGDEVIKLVRDLGVFSKQYIVKDLSGHDRFVCAERF